MAETETSVNIPQILAVALVGFFALRWFLNKSGSSTAPTGSGSSGRPRRVDVTKVDQISSMFPQLDRRAIAWDLERNGGSVPATTDRILGGQGLDDPPPTYRPHLPPPAGEASREGSANEREAAAKRKTEFNLIQKYDLQSRVGGKGKEPVPSEEQKRGAWSSDKHARAAGLRRRQEEMILAARRKMEEKEGGD